MQGPTILPLYDPAARFAPSQPRSQSWQVTAVYTGTNLAMTNNQIYYIPIFTAGGAIDTTAVNVTSAVASSVVRVGIYAPAASGVPGSLVAELGTIDTTATGVRTLSAAGSLPQGLAYLAVAAQGGASGATVSASDAAFAAPMAVPYNYRTATTNLFTAVLNGFVQGSVSGSFPATATPVDTGNANPKVGWRWT